MKLPDMMELLERWWNIDPNLPRDERMAALVRKLHESFWNDYKSILHEVRRSFPHLENEALMWYTERIQQAHRMEI